MRLDWSKTTKQFSVNSHGKCLCQYQASRWAGKQVLDLNLSFSEFWILSIFLSCYFSEVYCVFCFGQMFQDSEQVILIFTEVWLYGFFNSNVSEIWLTETASDSLKTGVTQKLISQELKDLSLSCKKHWKAYLILL